MTLEGSLKLLERCAQMLKDDEPLRQQAYEKINTLRRQGAGKKSYFSNLRKLSEYESKHYFVLDKANSMVEQHRQQTGHNAVPIVRREENCATIARREEETCPICRSKFPSNLLLSAHSVHHTQYVESYADGTSHLERCSVTAMSGLVRDFKLWSDEEVIDVPRWMRLQFPLVEMCMSPLLRSFVVRAMMYACVTFVQVNSANGEIVQRNVRYIPSHRTEQIVDLNAWYDSHVERIDSTLNKFLNVDGSDWQIECLNFVLLKVSLSENVSGQGAFQLPEKLKKMRAVVNVNCERDCFLYAVVSMLHYDDLSQHRGRPSKYAAWLDELNCEGLDLNDIDIARDVPRFERMNDIKVNVHVWERGLKGIRYNSKKNTSPRTVNLLLVVNQDGQKHYCGVHNLSRLYNHTKTSHNMPYMCERCIQSFRSKETYNTHYEWCRRGKPQIEEMPAECEYKYKSLGNELSPIRVVYADAECYIDKDTEAHVPAAVGMYDAWHVDSACVSKYKSWCGEDCVTNFLTELECMAKDQFEHNNMTRRQMIITPQQQNDFHACTHCPKCKKFFSDTLHKVRDHCHISGLYRGPLCHICNSRLTLKRLTLPVIFHNLKNYDAHMIIKHGIGKFKHWKLNCIAQTSEKFMTLTAKIPVGKTKTGKTIFFTLSFIDSFQFMPSSLATLAENHTTLPITEKLKQEVPSLTTEVLRRKGVFPYSYFSSFAVLDETQLPSREAFANDLTHETCSEQDYQHALRAWQEFRCKTFKDYMLRYLELDVRILADVFEEFRRMSLVQDGLDPVHYVSLPGLSFQSAFKMTNETIHLLQNPFVYNLFERGIRGGLTFVNTHHATDQIIEDAGHKYRQILMYIDQNNLYGASLSEYLPHSNFKILTDEEIHKLFPSTQHILHMDTETDTGYYFEVDLTYPTNIHHKTADFPLAPETAQVTEDMLSEHMKNLYQRIMTQRNPTHSTHTFKSSYKLLLSQNDKKNYCVHFKLLKYYLQQGMQLTKIHNCIQFTQKPFLRPYIEFNSAQRARAQSKHEKDFYKCKNNSLFGKTMEDVRKHSNYKLVTSETEFKRLASSPLFVDRDIITQDIVGVKICKPKVKLNRPIYIGQAVLDHSKLTMYQLFYQTLPSCPLIHKIKLLGGDTDSFFLQLTIDHDKTADDILLNLKDIVDFSNYPPEHPLYSTDNKARLGCFKDEVAGRVIEEMILLRPKMYSMKLRDNVEEIKRAKGIGRAVVKNLRHSDYQEAYHQTKESTVQMTILKSIAHTIHTHTFRKRALSIWEDKRVWIDVNESLPHGHVDSPVVYLGPKQNLPPTAGYVSSDCVNSGEKRKMNDDSVVLAKRCRND